MAVFVAIESKRPGGRVTEAQEEFLRDVTYDGGKAGVVHSVEELARVLGITVRVLVACEVSGMSAVLSRAGMMRGLAT